MEKRKIDFEKVTNFIKHKNFIMAFCVFCLTMLSIGVSYASFFTVKTNINNQTITTGTLQVSYGNKQTAINQNNMESMSDVLGMEEADYTTVYVQNTGTLDATFKVNIGYDMVNFKDNRAGYRDTDVLTPLDFVRLAVYQYNGVGEEDTLLVGPISVTDLPLSSYNSTDSRYNRYLILFDSVAGTLSESGNSSTKTYKIKMWLSDQATPSASYTYFYINTEVVAEVEHAKMSYNWSGVLKDSDGNVVKNATINFQNKSIIATTENNGSFTLNNIYPGVYNVEIIKGNKTYIGNVTFVEGDTFAVERIAATFPGMNIYTACNNYGTTINKILSKNNFDVYSGATELENATTYDLYATYRITGSSVENMTINIDLDSEDSFTLSTS